MKTAVISSTLKERKATHLMKLNGKWKTTGSLWKEKLWTYTVPPNTTYTVPPNTTLMCIKFLPKNIAVH